MEASVASCHSSYLLTLMMTLQNRAAIGWMHWQPDQRLTGIALMQMAATQLTALGFVNSLQLTQYELVGPKEGVRP